jgi:hypothetical protein
MAQHCAECGHGYEWHSEDQEVDLDGRPTGQPYGYCMSCVADDRVGSAHEWRQILVGHVGQYEFEIREDGHRLDGRVIDDPFLTTTITFAPSRWEAIRWLFRPLVKQYEVRVKGTQAAYRVVFSGDYTPPEPREPVAMEGAFASEEAAQP